MPIAIPLAICLGGWKTTKESHIPASDIVRRITHAFPAAVVDWDRGKQHRLGRVEQLISLGCPEVILVGERRLVDKTAYVGIEFPGWPANPIYSYVSDILPALEGVDFEAETYDIELLKRAGREISEALNFDLSLRGGGTTLSIEVVPGKHDPQGFVRERYEPNLPVPLLRELPNWEQSLHRGVVLFLRQYKQRNLIETMTQGFACYEEFATALLEELDAISPVQQCWSLDHEAPFGNAVLLEHGDWMTHIDLSGVPNGILT